MSPILVRPVREQLEHDRVIRLLQAKYKRKFEVAINPGNEQTMPVGTAPSVWYPDLVLQSTERNRKLLGTVEVETAESINNLEAMSQWATFSRLRAPFHLYIPAGCIDSVRRLCADLQISVAELWAYHSVGDQMRFTLVDRVPHADDGKMRAAAETPAARPRPSAAGRAAGASRPAAASAQGSAPARNRTTRAAAATGARRPASATASATRRKTATKAKAAAPRRAAPKPAVRKGGAAAARTPKRR